MLFQSTLENCGRPVLRFRGIPRHYLYDPFKEPWRTNPERLVVLGLLNLGQMVALRGGGESEYGF